MPEPDLPEPEFSPTNETASEPAEMSPYDDGRDQPRSADSIDETINFQGLNDALKFNLKAAASPLSGDMPRPESNEIGDNLDELAEDMLDMLKRLKSVEKRLDQISNSLLQVEQYSTDGYRQLGQKIDQLHQAVAGEKKALAVLNVFYGILPTLDILQTASSGLDADADTPVHRQMVALIDMLNRMLRSLGFTEFHANLGDPFDPHSMECLGHVEGAPGVVLKVVRPGYMIKEAVVRPVGVKIANSRNSFDEIYEENSL